MESKKNREGLNDSLSRCKECIRQAEEINILYERCNDILQDYYKLRCDYYDKGLDENYNYFHAIYNSVRTFRDEFSHMRAQGLEAIEELEGSVEELAKAIEELEGSVEENGDYTLYCFSDVESGIFFIQGELAYMRAQRLAEATTQLLEKCESNEQREKGTIIPPRKARKQRKREISQKRRDAVNARWDKERANAEASTPAESYKAANAVSVQSQDIVRGSERKALRKTYKPTHAQVSAYMQNSLCVREGVAKYEAAKFLDHYDALNWENKGTPITDWEACARNWVRRAAEYQGRGIFEEQERPKEPQGKPVTEEERQKKEAEEKENEELAMEVAAAMLDGRLEGGTGREALLRKHAKSFWERIANNELGGTYEYFVRKIHGYLNDNVPRYFADLIRKGDAGAMTKKVLGMIEAGVFTNDPLGYVARNVSRYLNTGAA